MPIIKNKTTVRSEDSLLNVIETKKNIRVELVESLVGLVVNSPEFSKIEDEIIAYTEDIDNLVREYENNYGEYQA